MDDFVYLTGSVVDDKNASLVILKVKERDNGVVEVLYTKTSDRYQNTFIKVKSINDPTLKNGFVPYPKYLYIQDETTAYYIDDDVVKTLIEI